MKTKLMIAVVVACAAAFTGCVSCSKHVQEAPVCGGYGNDTKLNAEDTDVWVKAVATRPDLKDYTPQTVSRQVVAGMNYRFTCRDKQGQVHTVHVFKPLQGEGEIKVTYVE